MKKPKPTHTQRTKSVSIKSQEHVRGIVGTNKTRHVSLCLSSAEKGSFGCVGLYVKEMLVMHHVPLLVVPVP